MPINDPVKRRAYDRARYRKRMANPKSKEKIRTRSNDWAWEYRQKFHDVPSQVKHRADTAARVRARRVARRALLAELKSKPCMDCGLTFPPVCMDFDHRPGTDKLWSVSRGLHAGTDVQLHAEIAKCDLVCANCHRIRTAARRDVEQIFDEL